MGLGPKRRCKVDQETELEEKNQRGTWRGDLVRNEKTGNENWV